MAMTAAAITAVASQPQIASGREMGSAPMIAGRTATYIMAAMIGTAGSTAEEAIAKEAAITPQGFCNKADGKFACLVEVTSDGQPVGSFVSVLTKGPEGWVAAE